MQEEDIPLPQIFDYMDYRAFLRDRLVALHARNPRYSQRWIAKRAGFQSLHLLSMILTGARSLAKDKVKPLAGALRLDPRESEYFALIHALSEAQSHDEQATILREIKIAFNNGMFSFFGEDAVKAISTWYLGAIVQLTTITEFREDPQWIAGRLGISPAEASDGLDFLLKHHFLARDGDKLVRSQPSLHNFGKMPPMTIAAYHYQIFEKAFQSINRSKEHRFVSTLTVSVARQRVDEFKEKIRRFCREFDMDIESASEPRNDVWQLAVAFFSLTPPSGEGL